MMMQLAYVTGTVTSDRRLSVARLHQWRGLCATWLLAHRADAPPYHSSLTSLLDEMRPLNVVATL